MIQRFSASMMMTSFVALCGLIGLGISYSWCGALIFVSYLFPLSIFLTILGELPFSLCYTPQQSFLPRIQVHLQFLTLWNQEYLRQCTDKILSCLLDATRCGNSCRFFLSHLFLQYSCLIGTFQSIFRSSTLSPSPFLPHSVVCAMSGQAGTREYHLSQKRE